MITSTLALIASAALVSGFGWYHVIDWYGFLKETQRQAQAEQTECDKTDESPAPGCGRRA